MKYFPQYIDPVEAVRVCSQCMNKISLKERAMYRWELRLMKVQNTNLKGDRRAYAHIDLLQTYPHHTTTSMSVSEAELEAGDSTGSIPSSSSSSKGTKVSKNTSKKISKSLLRGGQSVMAKMSMGSSRPSSNSSSSSSSTLSTINSVWRDEIHSFPVEDPSKSVLRVMLWGRKFGNDAFYGFVDLNLSMLCAERDKLGASLNTKMPPLKALKSGQPWGIKKNLMKELVLPLQARNSGDSSAGGTLTLQMALVEPTVTCPLSPGSVVTSSTWMKCVRDTKKALVLHPCRLMVETTAMICQLALAAATIAKDAERLYLKSNRISRKGRSSRGSRPLPPPPPPPAHIPPPPLSDDDDIPPPPLSDDDILNIPPPPLFMDDVCFIFFEI